ncbi:zinc ribbon domain-containing protein [Natronorubrum sp. A-ect3]
MERYEFTCPDCRRSFTVTPSMREATLTSGCPVCARSVTGSHFVPPAPSA